MVTMHRKEYWLGVPDLVSWADGALWTWVVVLLVHRRFLVPL